MRRARPSSLPLLVALALAPVMASSSAHASEPAAAEGDPLAQAKQLYNQGKVQFETAEYVQALILWNRAYVMLPPNPKNRPTRTALAANITEAHKRAYEVSRNPEHLHEGRRLLESRKAELTEQYGDDEAAVAERETLDLRLAELDALLAESASKGEVAAPLPHGTAFIYDGSAPPPDPNGQPDPGGQAAPPPPNQPPPPAPPMDMDPEKRFEMTVAQDPVLGPKWAKGKKQVGGGAAMVGIGGGLSFFAAGAIVLGVPASPFRGALLGVGGVFAAASLGLLVGGGIVLGKGVKARKEVRAAYEARFQTSARLVPLVMPGRGGGVGFVGQF